MNLLNATNDELRYLAGGVLAMHIADDCDFATRVLAHVHTPASILRGIRLVKFEAIMALTDPDGIYKGIRSSPAAL